MAWILSILDEIDRRSQCNDRLFRFGTRLGHGVRKHHGKHIKN